MEKLTAIVGGEKPQICKTLIHLVMADSAYVEAPKQGTVYSHFLRERQWSLSIVDSLGPPYYGSQII